MQILVTGGAGFIGSHIVDAYIEAGHRVVVIDDLSSGKAENLDPNAAFYQLDIRSPGVARIFEIHRPEVVSHHAAQMDVRYSVKDPGHDAQINILGTLNILEQCRRYEVRGCILASSGGAIYGEHDYLPTPEECAHQPLSPYGVGKLAAEHYLRLYEETFQIKGLVLRYANVYGPRQNPHGEAGVVAIFCQAMLQGKPLVVNGDGEQTRDYVYIKDVVKANLLALDHLLTSALRFQIRILNIGTGIETSVNSILEKLSKASGRRATHRNAPCRPEEQRRSALDSKRAQELLGWSPEVPLDEGLSRTFSWYEKRFHRIMTAEKGAQG